MAPMMSEYSTDEIPYRVMIVDDSAVIRGAIARAMENEPDMRVVGSCPNGDFAINMLRREPADVIVLDIEMPVMDGLTALPKLKAIDGAVQIIMASTLTQRNAEVSLQAMSLGATDYIPKPTSNAEVIGASDFKRELVEKVRVLGALARRSGVRLYKHEGANSGPKATASTEVRPRFAADKGYSAPFSPQIQKSPSVSKMALGQRPVAAAHISPVIKAGSQSAVSPAAPSATTGAEPHGSANAPAPAVAQVRTGPRGLYGDREVVLRKEPMIRPDIIAIGSSTGGPQALFKVIKDIGPDLSQPVIITQHMPPAFTTILAEHISRQCGVVCLEAKEGDLLQPKHFYIAPGDYHFTVEGKEGAPQIKLNKNPPENFCRPAVDPMLRSLIGIYGKRILVAILTGMGQDGKAGCDMIVKAGGAVIAQDEATSVVWGMPGAVATSGLCSAVLPLEAIGGLIRQTAMRPR